MTVQIADWFSREEMNRAFADASSKASRAENELITQHSPNSGMYYAGLGEIFANEAGERIDALRRTTISKSEKIEIAQKMPDRGEEIYLRAIESFGVTPDRYQKFVTRMKENIRLLSSQVKSWEDPMKQPERQLQTIEDKKAARFKLLEAAYNASKGDLSHLFNIYLLGDEIGLSKEDTRIEATHLQDQGHLRNLNVRIGHCAITTQGVDAYEKLIQYPEKGSEHFLPMSVVNNYFHGPMGIVQTGNGTISIQGAVTLNVQSMRGTDADKIASAFTEFIEGIANSDHIHEIQKKNAFEIIDTLTEEAKKPRDQWKGGVITALIGALGAIVGSAADLSTIWEKWAPTIMNFFEVTPF